MSVVVLYPDANNECIIMWVVETSSIFFRESNYRVVDLCHLWDKTYQLDILNNPKVSLAGFLGWTKSHSAPYNHPYVPYGWLRALVIPFNNLLLWWICPFFADESLQFPLSNKDFNLLFQVIAFRHVMTIVLMKMTILVSGPLTGISLQLAGPRQGCIILDLHPDLIDRGS